MYILCTPCTQPRTVAGTSDIKEEAKMPQAGKTRIKAQDAGWRGSVNGWLDAAYDALKESGVDAVRVMPLAKRLNLSRTSFYWFYEDREQLLAALLARWRDKNTGGLIGQCESYSESISEAILNVFECWLNPDLFDSQFEFAVRSWALQSAEVSAEIALADEARINALAAMFRRFGYEVAAADARARTIYLTQIGYISMKTTEDIVVRFRRIPEYVTVFTGKAPKRRELDRFYGKFGYAEKEPGVFVSRVDSFEEAIPDAE
jgi:AcrR family transcriptional regulator